MANISVISSGGRTFSLPQEIVTLICTFLPTCSVARFSQTCTILHGTARRVIYLRNVSEENSSIIKHGVLLACIGIRRGDSDLGYRMMRESIRVGGNINAIHDHYEGSQGETTVLHIATMFGNLQVTSFLLENGADVTMACMNPRGLSFSLRCNVPRPPPRMTGAFFHLNEKAWLPLLHPFLCGNKAMVKLLIKAGAPAELTSRKADEKGCTTVIHVVAVKDVMGLANYVFNKFPSQLDNLCRGSHTANGIATGSAVHMALGYRNWPILHELLRRGANVNLLAESSGQTPLHIALDRLFGHKQNEEERREIFGLVKKLLNNGASANIALDISRMTLSPLQVMLQAAGRDILHHKRYLRDPIDLLISHGADLNYVASDNTSVLHQIVSMICQLPGDNMELYHILQSLIDRGIDLNLRSQGVPSIAATVLFSQYSPTTLVEMLLYNGATLREEEAVMYFNDWLYKVYPHNHQYNMAQHVEHIPQQVIDASWHYAMQYGAIRALRLLIAMMPPPTYVNEWVIYALTDTSHDLFKVVRTVNFDPNYCNAGGGFLHHVLTRLDNNPTYWSQTAIEDIKFFIRKGTHLNHRNLRGKTAVQQLRCIGTLNKFRGLHRALSVYY